MKKTKAFILFFAASLILAACGNDAADDSAEKKDIIVGTSPGPYSELFIEGIVPILEDEGYTVEIKEFTDVRSVNIGIQEGSVDLNVDQHLAYMNNFNKESDADLAAITPIPTVPAGIHSEQRETIEEVQNGDKIGIPSDASNAARALLLLQKAGWITLAEGITPTLATQEDIVDNPYDLQILEMDSATIPRSLNDLQYGIIPGSILYAAGLSSKDSLLNEDVLPDLVLHAVVKEENKDSEWADAVVEAYRSDAFAEVLEEENTDNYWFIPEELK